MKRNEFWKESVEELYERLKSRPEGLSQQEAEDRLKIYGFNSQKPPQRFRQAILFFSQFKSPLILLLIGAATLSFFLGGRSDSSIIFTIVILSGLLGFFQERGAVNALEKLMQMVQIKVTIVREGTENDVPLKNVVPGDIAVLRAGDMVPADCVMIDGKSCFANEAMMSGESIPVEKKSGSPLFMGTVISSGVASAIVVITGRNTEYGHIAETTRFKPPKTAFEIGVKKFGYFLLIVTLVLVATIFIFNIWIHRPWLESFLFSLALAVGLTPQLLPAIISVNLSHGARKMAQKRVVVKRLASIENFGQMNILCADKTGTVTVGKIELDRVVNPDGGESEKAALYAFLNAKFQTAFTNPLDQAILEKLSFETADWQMTDEIPYDFERKRLSVIFGHLLIAKGAVPQILEVCNRVEWPDGAITSIDEHKERLQKYFEEQSEAGFRTIALAYGEDSREENLILLGFLHFFDPLKPDIISAIEELKKKGVHLKIITGDHHSVAQHVASAIGLNHTHLVTGSEIENITDAELQKLVKGKNVFAEINPEDKGRIVLALRKNGNVVGYLGDGINDVSALHSADVSISVDTGADVAKETADIVLLEKDLSVLRAGVEEGRLTFANTLKYVYMATSANFGNMFSMAGASLFLPFLPLLPKQVLLVNFLTDIPEMAIATDRVDPDIVHRPVKWDFHFILKFMLVFGLISSIFDYLTFGVLVYFLKADETLFQTGWFVESVISATIVAFAIRTRHILFHSRPGKLLAICIFSVAIGTLFIPYIPFLNFVPLPPLFYATLAIIIVLYIFTVEIAKRFFYPKSAA